MPPALEAFQQRRAASWAELAGRTADPRRRARPEDVLRFVRLHRQAVGDLALVRTEWPEEALNLALADLVAASAAALSRPGRGLRRERGAASGLVRAAAARVVEGWVLGAVAAAALVVPAALVSIWGGGDPESAARLVPVGLRRALADGEAVLPVGTAVGLLAFGGSGAGGLPGFAVLAWIGAILGAVPAAVEVAGPGAASSTLLLAAAVPGLLGIVIAAAAGLRLPAALLAAERPALRSVAAAAGEHLLAAVPLLVVGTVVIELAAGGTDSAAAWVSGAVVVTAAYVVAVIAAGRRLPAVR